MSFPTTQWSLMAIASMNGDRAGQEALEELCRRYRAPVLAFFLGRVPRREDAEDLTQTMFAYLVQEGLWRRADAAKGRFRSLVLRVARCALARWWRNGLRERHKDGEPAQSLDLLLEEGHEPPAAMEEGAPFDYAWACAAVAAALTRLESEAAVSPREAARFAVLRRLLPGSEAPPSYEEAAAELGVPAGSVKTYIHRLRADFRSALRAEIAQTLGSREDLEEEIAHLGRVLAAGQPGTGEKVGVF